MPDYDRWKLQTKEEAYAPFHDEPRMRCDMCGEEIYEEYYFDNCGDVECEGCNEKRKRRIAA